MRSVMEAIRNSKLQHFQVQIQRQVQRQVQAVFREERYRIEWCRREGCYEGVRSSGMVTDRTVD